MFEIDKEPGTKLSSSDLEIRTTGFWELWVILQLGLQRFFLSRTRNYQDTDDFLQETFVRVLNRLHDGPLAQDSVPERYVWRVANNLWRDHLRERYRTKPEAARTYPSAEEQVLEGLQTISELILHIPDEQERLLALMRWHLEHSPEEIVSITGWDKQEVGNALRRVKRHLQQMSANASDYLNTQSPWEKQLAFTGEREQRAFGISHVNISPQDIDWESEKELVRDLDVRNLSQAKHIYDFILRTDSVNTKEPREYLTIMPRAALKPGLFGEKPVPYLDCTLQFRRVKEGGSWKQVIDLANKVQYSARLTDTRFDEHAEGMVCEWVFPTLQLYIRKPLSEKMVFAALNPDSREESVSLYRAYPLDTARKHQGSVFV